MKFRIEMTQKKTLPKFSQTKRITRLQANSKNRLKANTKSSKGHKK